MGGDEIGHTQTNEEVDHSFDHGPGTNKRVNEVEIKSPDQPPIEGADHDKNVGNPMEQFLVFHEITSLQTKFSMERISTGVKKRDERQ